ncbi:MAG: CRTAC1 family protein [Pseudomonadota bacterium]
MWRVLSAASAVSVFATGLSVATEPSKSLADIPSLVEQAAEAGVQHSYTGPWEYYVGGGGAAFDCNGDRFPDMALAGGAGPSQVFVNQGSAGGSLKFEAKTGALPASALKQVTGFYPLDFNNDGHQDLIALRIGENLLLEGNGECAFKKANRNYAFDGGSEWTTAFSATFEAGEVHPTLAFGNYVDRSAPGSPWGTCHDNYLFRPGKGESASFDKPQVLSPGYCALSLTFTDWSRSGRADLRITNDRQYYRGGQEQMWRMEPGRPARGFRRGDGWQRVLIWGMGISEADLDGDGFPEYALTSMGDTKLQTLDSDDDPLRPTYRDIAFEKGATAHRPYTGEELKPSTGWHAEFADFNNDGRVDLYIAKGNVEAMPDFAAFDPDNLLLMQADGQFVESGDKAGLAIPTRGRGALVTDFNMDGMLDLAVVNRGGPTTLFQNTGARYEGRTRPMGNWLGIELRQKGGNRDAIGATISIKTGNHVQTRKKQIGGGHASDHLGFEHIGLGVAERATVRVKWPDGTWSHQYRVFANNFVVIERQAKSARYWYPTRSK